MKRIFVHKSNLCLTCIMLNSLNLFCAHLPKFLEWIPWYPAPETAVMGLTSTDVPVDNRDCIVGESSSPRKENISRFTFFNDMY